MATKFTPWQQEKIISAGGITLSETDRLFLLAHPDYEKKLLTIYSPEDLVEEGYIIFSKLVDKKNWINMHSLSDESARYMLLKLGFKREEWDENLFRVVKIYFLFNEMKGEKVLLPGGLLLLSDYEILSEKDTHEKVHLDGKRNCVIIDLFQKMDLEMNVFMIDSVPYYSSQKPTPIEEYGWAFTYEENGSYFLEEAVNKAIEVSTERFSAKKPTLQSNGGSLLTPAELEAFQTVGNVISSLGERLSAISAPKENGTL